MENYQMKLSFDDRQLITHIEKISNYLRPHHTTLPKLLSAFGKLQSNVEKTNECRTHA